MIIRKADISDSEALARYLFMAMEEIVYQFIGENNSRKAIEFISHFTSSENNQYSYQNCWVAGHEGQIRGAANIYDGAALQVLRAPIIAHIRENFNAEFTAEDETSAGEYYIDTLSVDPIYRGQGIGTNLLEFIIEEYAVKQQQTLGLLVDPCNPGARKLYNSLGFKFKGSKTLLGKQLEHLQFVPDSRPITP